MAKARRGGSGDVARLDGARRESVVRRALFVLAVALVLSAAIIPRTARGQQLGPSLVIQSMDASGFPAISATVSVLDANGQPIPGLTAAQFNAFDGDAPLTIAAATPAQDGTVPLGVVLVIDTSGSMAGEPIAGARRAATEFVRTLQPDDRVALLAFSDTVRAPAGTFTGERGAVTDAIAGLQAAGATALYDAVGGALLAAHDAGARKAIVLMTDGQNDTTGSASTRDASLAAAQAAGVPIFTIGFGDQPDVPYLQALAGVTNGTYSAATTANISEVYAGIARLLRGQYVLDLTSPHAADGTQGTLRIVATAAGTQLSATSAFARGAALAPAPASTAASTRTAGAAGSSSTLSTVLLVVLVIVVVGAVAAGAITLVRRGAYARAQRLREREAGPQSEESLPAPAARPVAPREQVQGHGRLVLREPGAEPRVFELGAGPAVIGSSPRTATIVLPAGADVASEHARIWLRQGRYLLHHAAGFRLKTLVGGREADWATLEAGDEIQVGAFRFVFEDGSPDPANGHR